MTETITLPSTEDFLRSQNDDPVYGPLIGFLKCPEQVEATQEIRDVLRDAGTYSLDIITGLLVYSYQQFQMLLLMLPML